jgi:hypothetical protein
MKRCSLFFLLVLMFAATHAGGRVVRLFSIGNSFSEDAVEQYLYELAAAQGDSLVIGNAYIGGCYIDKHWDNAQNDRPAYAYRKVVGGRRVSTPKQRLSDMLGDEPWDVVSFQQSSDRSGVYATFSHLPDLIHYVQAHVTAKPTYVFYMTWAYAADFKDRRFEKFHYSQPYMYASIREAVTHALADNPELTDMVPVGIAIQAVREVLGDTLNRDGYHLSYGLGRYTAACTWCEFLTGKPVNENTWCPPQVDKVSAAVARWAAHEAMRQSRYLLRR